MSRVVSSGTMTIILERFNMTDRIRRKREGKHIAAGLKWFGRFAGMLCLLLLLLAGGWQTLASETEDPAATVASSPAKKKSKKGKWAEKGGYYCYYVKHKRLKGLQKIGKRTYYFDDRGRQLTGWRKISGRYRFFKIVNGKYGYMVTSKNVNGIRLDKKGRAKVTPAVRKKLDLLVRYQNLADQLVTPSMDKGSKLVRVFKYARDKKYRLYPNPDPVGRWDEPLADFFLVSDRVDCTAQAAGFAYLANAVGYTGVSVRLYKHSHCEIGGRIYDPGFAQKIADSQYTRYFGRAPEELPDWGTGPEIPRRYV